MLQKPILDYQPADSNAAILSVSLHLNGTAFGYTAISTLIFGQAWACFTIFFLPKC